jgi:hypothetical protein
MKDFGFLFITGLSVLLLLFCATLHMKTLFKDQEQPRNGTDLVQILSVAQFSAQLLERDSRLPGELSSLLEIPTLSIDTENGRYSVTPLKVKQASNEDPNFELSVVSTRNKHKFQTWTLNTRLDRARPFLPPNPLVTLGLSNLPSGPIEKEDSYAPKLEEMDIQVILNAEKALRKLDLCSPLRFFTHKKLLEASTLISAVSSLSTAKESDSEEFAHMKRRWFFHMGELLLVLVRRMREISRAELITFLHGSKIFKSLKVSDVELMELGEQAVKIEIPVLLEEIDPKQFQTLLKRTMLNRALEYLRSSSESQELAHHSHFLLKLTSMTLRDSDVRTTAERLVLEEGNQIPEGHEHSLFGSNWTLNSSSPYSQEKLIQSFLNHLPHFLRVGRAPPELKDPVALVSLQGRLIALTKSGTCYNFDSTATWRPQPGLRGQVEEVLGTTVLIDPIFETDKLRAWSRSGKIISSWDSEDGFQWSPKGSTLPIKTLEIHQDLQFITDEKSLWILMRQEGILTAAWNSVDGEQWNPIKVGESWASEAFLFSSRRVLYGFKACLADAQENCVDQFFAIAGDGSNKMRYEIKDRVKPFAVIERGTDLILLDEKSGTLFRSDSNQNFTPFSKQSSISRGLLTLHRSQVTILDPGGQLWLLSEDGILEFLSRPRGYRI